MKNVYGTFNGLSMTKLIFLVLLLVMLGCSSKEKNKLESSEFLSVGSDISNHNIRAGVLQASPGLQYNPSGKNAFQISESQTLLRFKVLDDPVPQATTHGLAKLVIQSNSLDSIIHIHNYHRFIPDDLNVELIIDYILVLKKNYEPHKPPYSVFKYQPNTREASVYFSEDRDYTQIVNGMSLPEGEYGGLTIFFKKNGVIHHVDESWVLNLGANTFLYPKKFTINKGMITALNMVSTKNKKHTLAKIVKKQFRKCRPQYKHHAQKRKHELLPLVFHKFTPVEESIYKPVDQVYIKMKQLLAVNAQGERIVLNNTATEFELLSLRNGAVALIGSNAIPQGQYQYFEVQLEYAHRVVTDGVSKPLVIENQYANTLRFFGPFEARGGRLTEVFLDFDPNRSLFFFNNKGFILEPGAVITSVVSMTAEQEMRLVNSLSSRANEVLSNSERMLPVRNQYWLTISMD